MLDQDKNISPVYNLNESYNESYNEDGGIYVVQTEDEEEQNINKNNLKEELKILGFSWNLEIIKQKGFYHPKFVIYFTITVSIIVLGLITFIFGYGTNWNQLIYYPLLISPIMNFARVLYVLGRTQEQTKNFVKNIFFIIYEIIIGVLAFGGAIIAVIIQTPFNNETYFLIGLYLILFFNALVVSTTHDDQATPPWLSTKKKTIYPIQKQSSTSKSFQKKKIISPKTQEFDVYKKIFWTSLTLSTMCIDVLSDVYYGVDLIRFYGKNSLFLMIIGIILIFCCLWDLILVHILGIFPGWVSYSVHLFALIMEIPNVVLTGISLWKIHQLRYIVQKESLLRSLAIFSIITTALNALLHVVYIFDSWAEQNAIKQIQEL